MAAQTGREDEVLTLPRVRGLEPRRRLAGPMLAEGRHRVLPEPDLPSRPRGLRLEYPTLLFRDPLVGAVAAEPTGRLSVGPWRIRIAADGGFTVAAVPVIAGDRLRLPFER